MRTSSVWAFGILLAGCVNASALAIKDCSQINGVPERLTCLQSNDVILKTAIEALQKQVADFPKPPPVDAKVVRYGDKVLLTQGQGRIFCLTSFGATNAALCNPDNSPLETHWKIAPVKIPQ